MLLIFIIFELKIISFETYPRFDQLSLSFGPTIWLYITLNQLIFVSHPIWLMILENVSERFAVQLQEAIFLKLIRRTFNYNVALLLIQQQMRTRKPSENNIMEEAIQKASQLIVLLQKENHDLKRKVQNLQGELDSSNRKITQIKTVRDKLHQQMQEIQDKIKKIRSELQEQRDKRTTLQQSLKRKATANKELHQKLSAMSAKIKEKTRQCNEEKTKALSVQNQNQYLLKKLRQYQQKESLQIKKVNSTYKDLQKQLRQMQKLKDAFARRCEELKIDNATLTQAAASYKQRCIDGDELKKTMKIKYKEEVLPNTFVNDIQSQKDLQILIRQALGVLPNATRQGQIDQISSFIKYRLSHIEGMFQSIMEKLSIKQWKKIQNLRDLSFICQRISSYLSELLSTST